MKCPHCDFYCIDLETHLKFHVEVDFMADNENITPAVEENDNIPNTPLIIMLHMRHSRQDNPQIERLYILWKL